MAYRILILAFVLTGCFARPTMEVERLVGKYQILPTHFYKWGKEVNIDISPDSAIANIYNVLTKEVSKDTLNFIRSTSGSLIRLEGKTIVIKRSLTTRIFIREIEHGLNREDILEKFRVKK